MCIDMNQYTMGKKWAGFGAVHCIRERNKKQRRECKSATTTTASLANFHFSIEFYQQKNICLPLLRSTLITYSVYIHRTIARILCVAERYGSWRQNEAEWGENYGMNFLDSNYIALSLMLCVPTVGKSFVDEMPTTRSGGRGDDDGEETQKKKIVLKISDLTIKFQCSRH